MQNCRESKNCPNEQAFCLAYYSMSFHPNHMILDFLESQNAIILCLKFLKSLLMSACHNRPIIPKWVNIGTVFWATVQIALLILNHKVREGHWPVTHQVDGFSCGVCVINAVQHFIFSQEQLLLPHEAITEHYHLFLNIIRRHSDFISHLSFYTSLSFNEAFSIYYQSWRMSPKQSLYTSTFLS